MERSTEETVFGQTNGGKTKTKMPQPKRETDSGLYCESSHSKMTLEESFPGSSDSKGRETVRLNIGGTTFEVSVHTLRKIPGTRLCELAENLLQDKSYREESEDFYFDRNPAAFADIIEYYRSGELHMDQASCGSIFKKELDFWGLDFIDISMCCWSKFDACRADVAMYEELDNLFQGPIEITEPYDTSSNWSWVRFYTYHTLENPNFSVGAKIFLCISFLITTVSIFDFVAETHYLFQQLRLENGTFLPAPTPPAKADDCCCGVMNVTRNETASEPDGSYVDSHVFLYYLDDFTLAYFFSELLLRFAVSYRKRLFCREALNIIELICIVAQFISLTEHAISVNLNHHVNKAKSVFYLLLSLRIMRVFRIFRLFRHLTGFKVLVYTIVVSFSELLLILAFLFAGVLIFASIMHYVEEDTFTSIPFAIWWALVTMTTVGYGDVVPNTPMGYFIGSLCVVCGALVVAFTVPIVVNNFTIYYNLSKSRKSKIDQGGRLALAANAIKVWRKLSKYRTKTGRRSAVINPSEKSTP